MDEVLKEAHQAVKICEFVIHNISCYAGNLKMSKLFLKTLLWNRLHKTRNPCCYMKINLKSILDKRKILLVSLRTIWVHVIKVFHKRSVLPPLPRFLVISQLNKTDCKNMGHAAYNKRIIKSGKIKGSVLKLFVEEEYNREGVFRYPETNYFTSKKKITSALRNIPNISNKILS